MYTMIMINNNKKKITYIVFIYNLSLHVSA
jgi:hypothetical protein